MDDVFANTENGHTADGTDRRALLRQFLAVGGIGALAPMLAGAVSAPAFAQANTGVGSGQGDVVFINAASAQTIPMAEWESAATGAEAAGAQFRYALGAEGVAKAPAGSSHYEARTFMFPSGGIRVLTYKKGGPVLHQITFETEIYVLQGSVTLQPLYGFSGTPLKVNAGDALFLPSGVLRNAKPTEDTVLVTMIVGNTAKEPKSKVVTAKEAQVGTTVQWEEGGKEMTATKPEEIKKAPAGAAHFTTKRYIGDGNSIRVATLKKGGRTGHATTGRTDVVIYVAKGHMRRTEGTQVFELKAGDATREKLGNPGYWELLEDSVFIATDAPLNPANYSPAMVAR